MVYSAASGSIPTVDDGPVRVQLSRAKGWRMPENTVKVDRTTKRGNPFVTQPDSLVLLSPLERDRLRSVVIEALERAFWAGSEMAQGYDALAEADMILAEPARGAGET